MHPTSELLEKLLQDDSFPSMAILDGVWGEGKTYFAKSTLLKELEKDGYKTFYLSLTGIANVSEYRDRLLSVSFETIENTSRFFKKHSNIIGQVISSATGQSNGGLIGGVLAGSAGIVREKLLHKLDNIRFIVDDLDRVRDTDHLCDLIVGESLQLADSESKNIQFIFVVNESKSCLSPDLREKAFCGKAILDMRFDDLIDIAFKDTNLNSTFLLAIKETIKQKDIKNLRVLKRLANKAKAVNELISEDDEIDQQTSFSYIGQNLTLICHYLYQKGYSSEQVWGVTNESPWDIPDSSTNEEKELSPDQDLKNINYGISEKLIQHCAFETSEELTLRDLGRLPLKASNIDKLLFSYPEQLEEKVFINLFDELKRFIFDGISVPLRLWFEACVYYEQQVKLSFVSEDLEHFIDSFDALCAGKEFYYAENSRWSRLSFDGAHEKIERLYNEYHKVAIETNDQLSNKATVIEITNSWNEIGQKFYNDYQLKPFFNVVMCEDWKQCIDKWSPSDFGTFSRDMYSRYRPSNINDYLSCEYESLKSFHDLTLDEIENTETGLKKGAMVKANLALAQAIKQLTPSSI